MTFMRVILIVAVTTLAALFSASCGAKTSDTSNDGGEHLQVWRVAQNEEAGLTI